MAHSVPRIRSQPARLHAHPSPSNEKRPLRAVFLPLVVEARGLEAVQCERTENKLFRQEMRGIVPFPCLRETARGGGRIRHSAPGVANGLQTRPVFDHMMAARRYFCHEKQLRFNRRQRGPAMPRPHSQCPNRDNENRPCSISSLLWFILPIRHELREAQQRSRPSESGVQPTVAFQVAFVHSIVLA